MNGCASWLITTYSDSGEIGKLQDVNIRNNVYRFTSLGKYYELEHDVMTAIARDYIRKYDILPGINSTNKITLQDLKNKIGQLEQQVSLRMGVNSQIVDKYNIERTEKKRAYDQLHAQGRILENTLQNENNSVLSLNAKVKQLTLENKVSAKIAIDLRDQCIEKTKELTELSLKVIQTKIELKNVEDVVCEKKILINTKELKISELENMLAKIVQENEKVFKNLESSLANKITTYEKENKRFKRLLTTAQKSERQLRNATDKYESNASSSESESSQDG